MRRLGLLVVLVVGAGCVTPYQRQGFAGGYSEYPLDSRTYVVSFGGNGFTSVQTVRMYLHYRCAELTLETGNDYFEVLGAENLDWTGEYRTAGHAYTTTTGNVSVYGNTAYGSAQSHTRYTPGQTTTIVKPGRSATIRMFRGERPEGTFDAREVIQMLGPQVGARTSTR